MLAREMGKWVGEFRRASNEFKMQMEEELRLSEQADRQKQIAAMEAAAPVAPSVAEPEQPQLATGDPEGDGASFDGPHEAPAPLPIATSGELSIMPPATGLPTPRGGSENALSGLVESIPEVQEEARPLSEMEEHLRENALHGD